MDFGVVMTGSMITREFYGLNSSSKSINLQFDRSSLQKAANLGFIPNISKIHQLPGSPNHDLVKWEITFDSKVLNQISGSIETELLICVS